MTRRVFGGFVAIAGFVSALAGYQFRPDPDSSVLVAESVAVEAAGRALPVHVTSIEPVDHYERTSFFTGRIEAARTSDPGFELAGLVVEISVEEGDRVEAGQVLGRLETTRLEIEKRRVHSQLKEAVARLQLLRNGPRDETIAAARAALRRQESNLKFRSSTFDRRQQLVRAQAVSEEEVDQSRFGLDAARAQVESARQQLNELLEGTRDEEILAQDAVVEQLTAAFHRIEADLDDSILRAPFAGTVSRRWIDEGSVIASGAPVVRVVENDCLEARIGVSADLARELQEGDCLPMECGSLRCEASVRCILPELDRETQTLTVILDVDASASARPAVGELARVTLRRRIECRGFWLPATAIERGQRGLWSAYVVDPAGQADGQGVTMRTRRRDVELLFHDERRVFLRGTMRAGEQVVSSGLHRLSNEQLVCVASEYDGMARGSDLQPVR